MRYMMMFKATPDYEAGRPPSPALMASMGALTEKMMKAGVVLLAEGLQPSSQGTRVTYAGGKRTVTDGPFAEAKELIGGFAIVEAKSKDEALALANRVVEIHVEAGVPEFEMEIRPLFGPGDCGPPKR